MFDRANYLKIAENDPTLDICGYDTAVKMLILAKVGPKTIGKEHPLYCVDGKNKGVYYKTDTLGDITVIGGASSPLNAAASILRDLLSI